MSAGPLRSGPGGISWTRPALSLRAAAAGAALLLLAAWLAGQELCRAHKLHEAALHARGLWRAPRLGADSFIARRVKATGRFEVLLAQRTREPFKGAWCVPGGFVVYGEDPLDAVAREIKEETRLEVDKANPPVFVNFRGSPKRDPRAHSLSVSYIVRIDPASLPNMKSGDDAGTLRWFPLEDILSGSVPFAFDHGEIAKDCAKWFEEHGKTRGLYVEV